MAKKKDKQTAEDVRRAFEAVNEFFLFYGNDKALKEDLWWMVKVALTNEGDETSANERDKMIYLYEQLSELAEAAYILHQHEKGKKQKSK